MVYITAPLSTISTTDIMTDVLPSLSEKIGITELIE
jgi:hypothetical protein